MNDNCDPYSVNKIARGIEIDLLCKIRDDYRFLLNIEFLQNSFNKRT